MLKVSIKTRVQFSVCKMSLYNNNKNKNSNNKKNRKPKLIFTLDSEFMLFISQTSEL